MSGTRRDFLKAALGSSTLLSFASATPDFLLQAAAAAPRREDRDTALVLVQLSGGNDGLNTIVPYGDDEYGRNRSTLRLATDKLHKIDSHLGFHPRMGAFMRLYDEGHLSVIRGVGYPNMDRSHESAMRIWHTADPGQSGRQTGWLGRAVDSVWKPDRSGVPAVFVGPIARPFALNAWNALVPAIHSADDLTADGTVGGGDHPSRARRAANLRRDDRDNPLLRFLRQSTVNAHTSSRRIKAVAKASAGATGYPPMRLAEDLRTVAQLIRADTGIRIFFTEMGGGGIGGFDNHANQLGNHCALLHQLSESVAAFVRDLKRDKLLDRVLLMTFSEFGRTLKENGRRGTDHGAAAPIFLAGGKLKSGLIGGPHPNLVDLDNGALKFHVDFRRVYATVLDQWLGFDSRAILDGQLEPLDVLRT